MFSRQKLPTVGHAVDLGQRLREIIPDRAGFRVKKCVAVPRLSLIQQGGRRKTLAVDSL
jgi:hypothetical protein